MRGMKIINAATLGLVALSGTAYAQEAAMELPSASGAYIKDYESFKLAANETDMPVKKSVSVAPEIKQSEFEPSWLTGSKAHQYLGLATIVGAGLTALTAPEECEHNCTTTTPRETNGTHAKLAKATVAMAAATIVTGLIVHWDDIHLDEGFTDPDNLHVMFGVTGAALMAYAVNKSKNSSTPVSHAAMAELGAVGMLVAIKLTW
jgi:hypothetical protein